MKRQSEDSSWEKKILMVKRKQMKRVLLIGNHEIVIYNFRLELIAALLNENDEVFIMLPKGEKVSLLEKMGCHFIEAPLDRHGVNPFSDLALFIRYYRSISLIKPDMIFTYTIKPNIYGGMAGRILKIPYITNITGLGSAVENKGILQYITVSLYRLALKRAHKVYFQNKENMAFFRKYKIALTKGELLPGSGVNLEKFKPLPYPSEESLHFIFIARVMKEKGIEEYLKTAKYIKRKYPNTNFHIFGFCEERYEPILDQYEREKIITYHGMVDNIQEYISMSHCTIHPSYYPEGMSNVCLESAASARPVITTTRSGCRETVKDAVTGYLVEPQNTETLIDAVERFIGLTHAEKKKMGLEARKYMEDKFDRNIVVDKYLKELHSGGE